MVDGVGGRGGVSICLVWIYPPGWSSECIYISLQFLWWWCMISTHSCWLWLLPVKNDASFCMCDLFSYQWQLNLQPCHRPVHTMTPINPIHTIPISFNDTTPFIHRYSKWSLFFSFLTRTSYAFLITPTQATCLIPLILLNFTIIHKHNINNSEHTKKKTFVSSF